MLRKKNYQNIYTEADINQNCTSSKIKVSKIRSILKNETFILF